MATEEPDAMYHCNICNKVFELQSMYACYHGHYLCRKCYKQVYYRGKERRCPHGSCNAFIVKNRDATILEPMERSKLMFPNPSIFSQCMDIGKSFASLSSIYKTSSMHLGYSSKKPIHCPHHGCNKTIAVSSLDSHFQHDHSHVSSIITNLETRNGLEFSFRDLYGDVKSVCLVSINLEEKEEDKELELLTAIPINLPTLPENNTDRIEPQRSSYSKTSQLYQIPKPFFILMAAKLTTNDFSALSGDDEEDEIPDSGFSTINRVIFYLISNIATNYSYTIAISTPDQMNRVKYYGPLPSMNENYTKLCEEGRGLILNNHHLDGMGDYGNRHVSIDIIIHDRAEETYDSD